MPLRFNKEERDEWRSRMAGKSHTCEACCAGDCKDCSGTCDCKDCHKSGSNASVLDALESKTDKPARWAAKQAAPVFPNTHNQVAPQAPAQAQQEPAWGRVQACPQCGHGMHTYEGQRGAMCSNCGHEEAVMAQQPARTADASMPPEAPPYQQKETALPYNPAAYEGQVEDMHPAAQYTYQRAVAQGSDPQAAYQAAQEKQGEMGKRTQEGQNTEGVQIPVINTSYHGDQTGFVSSATIKRISHLL